jgi:hypothetical protein
LTLKIGLLKNEGEVDLLDTHKLLGQLPWSKKIGSDIKMPSCVKLASNFSLCDPGLTGYFLTHLNSLVSSFIKHELRANVNKSL